jgi:hypothetical protein
VFFHTYVLKSLFCFHTYAYLVPSARALMHTHIHMTVTLYIAREHLFGFPRARPTADRRRHVPKQDWTCWIESRHATLALKFPKRSARRIPNWPEAHGIVTERSSYLQRPREPNTHKINSTDGGHYHPQVLSLKLLDIFQGNLLLEIYTKIHIMVHTGQI